ncbi:MAG TPA: hypothetical protein DEA05_10200 [Rhodobacteraceae bacterium]|nr:hypothetical protein [Paracoccaceae bacterium]
MKLRPARLIAQSSRYLLSGVVGGGLVLLAQEWFEVGREKRDNLQTYVTLFHGDHIGMHKDRLLAFLLEPEVQARLGGARDSRSYAAEMFALLDTRAPVTVSLYALTGFFQAALRCAEERRCDEARTLEAFRLYVNDFYPVFYPALRRMDCAQGAGNAEDSLLQLYSGPPMDGSRCALVAGL